MLSILTLIVIKMIYTKIVLGYDGIKDLFLGGNGFEDNDRIYAWNQSGRMVITV